MTRGVTAPRPGAGRRSTGNVTQLNGGCRQPPKILTACARVATCTTSRSASRRRASWTEATSVEEPGEPFAEEVGLLLLVECLVELRSDVGDGFWRAAPVRVVAAVGQALAAGIEQRADVAVGGTTHHRRHVLLEDLTWSPVRTRPLASLLLVQVALAQIHLRQERGDPVDPQLRQHHVQILVSVEDAIEDHVAQGELPRHTEEHAGGRPEPDGARRLPRLHDRHG